MVFANVPVFRVLRAHLPPLWRAGPRALAALATLAGLGLLVGCSQSHCLREDCQTSAHPETSSMGGARGLTGKQKCETNVECQTALGEACVAGTCRLACQSHFDCQGLGECQSGSDSSGVRGHYCERELDHVQKPGQFYSHCTSGTNAECDEASGFFCVSAGAADVEAYCTSDCTDDASCAAGYACLPLIRTPCDDVCNLTGNPKDRACIPSDQIGQDKPYQCGSRGVTRNACRPRKFCSTCESDADCLAAANQVCAKDRSGAKICTQLCDVSHASCPWGNAATCGVWDAELGLATCAHRFGQCTGTGKGCEPCLKDSDCGAKSVCTSSSFTGERWCVDLKVNCSCAGDADGNGLCTGHGCPTSPSGLDMLCLDATPESPSTGVCAGANTNSGILSSSSQQTGCWPDR